MIEEQLKKAGKNFKFHVNSLRVLFWFHNSTYHYKFECNN